MLNSLQLKIIFLFVECIQKNRLSVTVLLSIQNIKMTILRSKFAKWTYAVNIAFGEWTKNKAV